MSNERSEVLYVNVIVVLHPWIFRTEKKKQGEKCSWSHTAA